MSIAFALAAVVFSVFGYRYASTYGSLAGVGGAICGVVVGFVATPLVFLLLMGLVHIGVKLEDWFRKPRV